MRRTPTKNWKDTFKTAGIYLTPIVIGIVSGGFALATKDQEVKVRYVELAISILREEPKPETRNLREWAIAVINTNSNVKLKSTAIDELIRFRLSSLNYKAIDIDTLKKVIQSLEKQENISEGVRPKPREVKP